MTVAGELAMLWTVRASVACYLVRVLADAGSRRRPDESVSATARVVWTAGALLMATHILLAIGLFHEWSLARTWEHTAERTAEVTGWRWGGGLVLNFVLVGWWLADAVLSWTPTSRHLASNGYRLARDGFFAFMFFNATVVFGPIGWTWVAVPFAVILVAVLALRFRRSNTPEPLG